MVLELDLPTTVQGSGGLTVDGASPELLADLLEAYSALLARVSPHISESMAPGLGREEIVERLGDEGLVVHEELIVWWMWRNGHIPGIGHGLRQSQHSLEEVLLYRARDVERNFAFMPSSGWLRIAGSMRHSVAVGFDPAAALPPVRRISPEHDAAPEVTHRQAISLCTFVTWKLVAIEKGWDRYNQSTGFWELVDYEAIPFEWRLTGIV